VNVIMTQEAQRFVGALTFSALTGRATYASLWDAPETISAHPIDARFRGDGRHSATANAIAKLAHGIADDLLTNAALAARIPIVIAPAMNDAMYEHEATKENLRTLLARGYEIVEPASDSWPNASLGSAV